jgi:hypothetical protein
MIQRLRKVTNGFFRGSAPTSKDVIWLKDNLGINKIVSLDQQSGDKICRVCQILGIDHVKLYIDHNRQSLYHALNQDLKKLFLDNGPTYVHCRQGKDRTGLMVALFKCKYMDMKPTDAIQEAKSLGFGIGISPQIIHLYEKIISSCTPYKDINNAESIVGNEREYIGDNRDSFLDEANRGSFAPYLDHTKQAPMDALYNYIDEQSPTRQNYDQEPIKQHNSQEDIIPQVGIFNNDAGIYGGGPTENNGGFIYD